MTSGRERLGREYFDGLYESDPDPWNFETSGYEREKYAATLHALGTGRFRRALEVGCSIGVFTALLARRCDDLLSVDTSDRAVARARERLAGEPHVRIEKRTIPEEMPAEEFDLVIASEVLYYLPQDIVLEALAKFEAALAPGGRLVAVHWRRETKTYPMLGDEVHDLLRSRTNLAHESSTVEADYVLDVFRRVPNRGGS